MGGMGVGEAALIAATIASTAGTAVVETQRRKDGYRQAKRKQEIDEKNRKNILEEQLAKRRAAIGSLGISSSGSVLSSQDKMIKDSYKNISQSGSYNSDAYYYSKMGMNLLNGANNVNGMIK